MSIFRKILDYLCPLWEDVRGKISLGRVSFWVVLGFFLYRYFLYGEISYNIVTLLLGLLAYGGFKKYIHGRFELPLFLGPDETKEA